MIEVIPGATVLLPLALADGAVGLFPRADVYDDAGAAIAGSPFVLTHTALGLYQVTFAAPPAGDYSVIYTVYSDAGHTTVASTYGRADEALRVFAGGGAGDWSGDEREEIRGALGIIGTASEPSSYGQLQEALTHEGGLGGVVDEALARDGDGLITSAVRRIYDNDVDAIADNTANARKTVVVSAVNSGAQWDKLTRYVGAGPGAFTITSLVKGFTSPLEVGENVVTPAFTASYSTAPTSAVLDDSEANPTDDVIGAPTAFASTHTYFKNTPGGSVVWTLTADDGGAPDTRITSAVWYPGVFTGLTASAGPYSEADIEALVKRLLVSSQLGQIILTPATEYIVHAYPDSYGPRLPADFQIGNIGPGDMTEVQTGLNITNPFGVLLPYSVARSDFQLNSPGGIEFEVFS